MDSYTEETYGERAADVYDQWYGDYDRDAINVLAELERGGRALELGVGTGRIALPLMARNVEVHGLDAATSMVARLRAKPGGNRVPVSIGNFADVAVDGEFTLIYVVFNTFFALLSQINGPARGPTPASPVEQLAARAVYFAEPKAHLQLRTV